jgi:cyclopropane fatty-acyl-phospholipid synthase-like methyltransferase
LTCVEIGAMPGNHLVYFSKEFGYRVTGIDYCSDLTPIVKTMELNGIENYSLINADVFSLREGRLFDVVFSSGFVEHFEDYRGVVALHADMVKAGGYLLITVPNTKYLHKCLMRMFCPDIYRIHRDYLMDRQVLCPIVEKLGFEVLHCNYLRTFRPFYPLPNAISFGMRVVNKLLRLTRLDRIPNAFASPYLYLIAVKSR